MAERGAKKWTDQEKTLFLVQAVKQMQADGGKLNFKKIVIEGRTPKALTHLWDKLSKQEGDSGDVDDATEPGSEQPSTPAPNPKLGSATPGSRKRTAKTATIGEGDAGDVPPTPTAKRQRKAPAKSKAKTIQAAAATQTIDDDEPEDIKPELKMEQHQQQNYFNDGEV
ncbi:hypothetical protein FHL15_002118 [Xylaria flabelliformis]|uniref:Myb-like domain-containing protein n=1 Tax=Xylaria flabelliformis TaxID=2512241 RepID=A0A553I9F6_9PEZI|nr:hypothetical protein FHL15_002118 [Xylaria flabelliformis]